MPIQKISIFTVAIYKDKSDCPKVLSEILEPHFVGTPKLCSYYTFLQA